ncbi:TPA: DeoR family transcriptional regulator [Candidatus Micrarchaeota archaeon]|nr:MAG: hypothetical protein AUJ65_04730 [Candidatus Micrarchaeota archaeon CG1_02_51_15]HII39384.1 DeoR family transcriptional regulator [Candidatus Micrarchaeota archaeon]
MVELPGEEGEAVEFKRSFSDSEGLMESVCAFLNKKGGVVFVGIDDAGNVVGVDVGKNTLENFSATVRATLSPSKFPLVETLSVNDARIVAVRVIEGDEKPYFYKGKAFVRVGRANVAMDARAIEKEFKARLSYENRAEDALTRLAVKDYSPEAVDSFYKNARENVARGSAKTLFANLSFEKNGFFNNAGALCFSKNPQSVLPQFAFRCAILRGNELVSISLFEGNVFQIIENTFQYVKNNFGSSFKILGTTRQTTYDYPLDAVREAVINSLIHRDLLFPSSNYLAIYDDRLEIRNPGQLAPQLSLEQLKREHASVQRNKKLAHALYLANYIEHWGAGTLKMVSRCREAGMVDPEFMEENGFFTVRFWKKKPFSNPRLQKAAEYLKQKQLTSNEYSKKFKVTSRTARADLNLLLQQGFAVRQKAGKRTIYSHPP